MRTARRVQFEILDPITQTEVIAQGAAVRAAKRLRRIYGGKGWRKVKGLASVRFDDGTVWRAEVHWYESHGIGRKEYKIKRQWHE